MSLTLRRLSTTQPDFKASLANVLAFEKKTDESINTIVASILEDVRTHGDKAVLEYSNRFDRLGINDAKALEISLEECQAALASLTPERRKALQTAADRIRKYHEYQKASCGTEGFSFTDEMGNQLGQKVTPLDSVGIYVPGGKAAYPSSVLMNAIPAQVAGVREIVMAVPTPDGVRNELVLAAAAISGVTRVFTVGGAQAVAALAYGTETIPSVDKIVGPGNAFVAEAKRRVFGTVGIDMIAGPSEILVICDGSTDPDWIAMDLFSQAEHDELAQSILITPDTAYMDKVEASINRLLPDRLRKDIITKSLSSRGAMILVKDMAEACEIANQIAPEHLEISAENPEKWGELCRHVGSIFLGRYTCESLGDYCAGANHVLPTSRTARFSSPLGVYDFQKRSALIWASAEGSQALGEIAVELATGEGLEAHAGSAVFRLKK